jgi:ABC-type nickel/cobalt efflux system permease component RcnA
MKLFPVKVITNISVSRNLNVRRTTHKHKPTHTHTHIHTHKRDEEMNPAILNLFIAIFNCNPPTLGTCSTPATITQYKKNTGTKSERNSVNASPQIPNLKNHSDTSNNPNFLLSSMKGTNNQRRKSMEKAASMFAGCKLHTNTAHTQKHTHKTRSRFDFLCGDTKTHFHRKRLE